MVAVGLAAVAVAFAFAFFIPWLPENASEERNGIDFVFWLTTTICIFIFGLVTAMLLYAVVAFRAREGDDTDGKPIHGHTGIEIAWTAVPTLLVLTIVIASTIVLAKNEDAGASPNHIDVTAQQFAWHFDYGEKQSGTLRLPVDRSTVLRINAIDVIHSFWVPEFLEKRDLIPGVDNAIDVTVNRAGTWTGRCAEFCGLDHWRMNFEVQAMAPDDFEAWLAEQPPTAGAAST
jgi:cytochrome c oxidase subunit II